MYFLQKQQISRLDVLRYISHGISKVESEGEGTGIGDDVEGEEEERRSRPKDPLGQFCVDLNAKAAKDLGIAIPPQVRARADNIIE